MAVEQAYAKVNLALHVTGQRGDGYHLLDSLVVFCGIGDWLTAEPAQAFSLTVKGPFAGDIPQDGGNLVLRAAQRLAPDRPMAFVLHKALPPASGIGGGTADAAAALRAMLRRDGDLAERVDRDFLLGLGADLPVCFAQAPARMRGVGEVLDAVTGLPPAHLVLANPRVEVPTPVAFKALTQKDNPSLPPLPNWPTAQALARWLKDQRNDLQAPAGAHAPVIDEVLGVLGRQDGALLARMSGSGATCFALFETAAQAEAARAAVQVARPGWWVASGPMFTGPV